MALFPRHTPGSVRRTARNEGLSRPRAGVVKFRPGLDRLLKLLESAGPLTTRQLGERLGITQGGAEELKRLYRTSLRIAGWNPPVHGGKWAPRWSVANGLPDAPKPFQPRNARSLRKPTNPFSVAAGTVKPPTAKSAGRIYAQDMDIEEWGQSRKVTA